jgi:hypothetical protein
LAPRGIKRSAHGWLYQLCWLKPLGRVFHCLCRHSALLSYKSSIAVLNLGATHHNPTIWRTGLRILCTCKSNLMSRGNVGTFRYMRGYAPQSTGMWLIFFAGCGPICILEGYLLSMLKKRGIVLPWWFTIPATVFGGILWGHLYFFPPTVNSKLASDVINEVSALLSPSPSFSSAPLLAGAEL